MHWKYCTHPCSKFALKQSVCVMAKWKLCVVWPGFFGRRGKEKKKQLFTDWLTALYRWLLMIKMKKQEKKIFFLKSARKKGLNTFILYILKCFFLFCNRLTSLLYIDYKMRCTALAAITATIWYTHISNLSIQMVSWNLILSKQETNLIPEISVMTNEERIRWTRKRRWTGEEWTGWRRWL